MDKHRKLLVMGLNELLQREAISLEKAGEDGHLEALLAGETCMIIWREIGYDEAAISVWWKYDHRKHPQADLTGNERESFNCNLPLARESKYPTFIGAAVSGWLERRTGKHLQGCGRERLLDIYTRRGEREVLDALPTPTPLGYVSEGKFFF